MMSMSGPARHVFPAVSACISCLVLVHPFMPTSTPFSFERHTIVARHIAALHPRLPFTVACFVPHVSLKPRPSPVPPATSLNHLSATVFHFFYLSQQQPKSLHPKHVLIHPSYARTHPCVDYLCIYSPGGIYLAQKKWIFKGRAGICEYRRSQEKRPSS
ncbi:hypothetical protein BGW80DRAFT_297596 [Lactifluus volemus]|nr:hypothetical protein BGW80DRAFT_297596 [Lactifluus volemus]